MSITDQERIFYGEPSDISIADQRSLFRGVPTFEYWSSFSNLSPVAEYSLNDHMRAAMTDRLVNNWGAITIEQARELSLADLTTLYWASA